MTDLATLRALSAAHALALKARCGRLDRQAVAALAGSVALRDPADPVRCAIDLFDRRFGAAVHDRTALADAGADLQRDVLRLLRPDVVDAGRVDIHG